MKPFEKCPKCGHYLSKSKPEKAGPNRDKKVVVSCKVCGYSRTEYV